MKKLWKSKKGRLAILLAAAVIAVLIPPATGLLNGGAYLLNVINYVLVYAIAAAGLNIMTGYSGQINLGAAAYFSVGAYGGAILTNAGLPTWLSLILAMLMVAFLGLLTAIPAAKLKYHFLALATLAVGEVVNNFIKVSPGGITGDTSGLYVDALRVFGMKLNNDKSLYFFLLLMTLVCFGFTWAFVNSGTGRACIAVRDNLDAAESCGVDIRKYKIVATLAACLVIGFAGFLFAYLNRYISPDTFAAGKSTMFLSMMMLGGAGTMGGPILGAVLVTLIMEILRDVPGSGSFQQMSYGVILLIVLMFLPQGLSGVISDIRCRRLKNTHRRREEEESHAES